jgi:hypothetical protein
MPEKFERNDEPSELEKIDLGDEEDAPPSAFEILMGERNMVLAIAAAGGLALTYYGSRFLGSHYDSIIKKLADYF